MRTKTQVHELIQQVKEALGRAGEGSSDFDLNPDVKLPPNRKLRPAGVLMPIVLAESGPRLILTKRSSALKHHPGQIAFPGGKVEDSDSGVIAAALREADEEIGLPPRSVRVLGDLAPHETVTSFLVTPVVALVEQPFQPVPEPGEVAEVFSVPLDHVLNTKNFVIQGRRWRGQRRYYYTIPYGPYYIWGASARMLHALASRMV
ncbi:CoA pyrophosphatase [Epibacterium ulvae]|uniref:CoA pyrophosphatase n=1 Tax=Epibacterium ulvae TaxID=1156985 RepID=UPI001BFC0179|nr:CoA pyrophosphatase [Epibacterium ulvae]MBT8153576.1 CoA pyrophosphatase [Epibacterium ulvae]